ncbi:MAG: hypothetical protein V3S29_13165, partial [bacterium]
RNGPFVIRRGCPLPFPALEIPAGSIRLVSLPFSFLEIPKVDAVASSDVQRKLTAILCADVVGYSRLMGENEKATLRTLTDYRQVFSEYIGKFRGRIVNAPGDSILAEFASVVDAVNGAVEIQRNIISKRVLGLPELGG